MLFATLIYFVLLFLVAVGIIPEKVTYFYALIVFLPNLAVTIRRLHDLGFSGWWLLAGLIPFVGLLGAIPLLFEEGEKRRNKYGPNPKRWTLKLMKQQSETLTKGWRMLHIIQTIPLARSTIHVLRALLDPEGYWTRKVIDNSTLRYCRKLELWSLYTFVDKTKISIYWPLRGWTRWQERRKCRMYKQKIPTPLWGVRMA